MKDIFLKPRISEKSYDLSKIRNTYVFEVSSDANKHTVAAAVAKQYEVNVVDVNIANIKGKTKRTYLNRRGKSITGSRSDVKKAYVVLKEGETLPIFAAEDEAEAKAEKAAKKAEKKAKKESK